MSDYEPPAEQVEALAKELHDAGRPAYGDRLPWQAMADVWQTMMRAEARFVLRRQHERERGLVGEMRAALDLLSDGYPSHAQTRLLQALAAHAKLDAPKVPTLLEAAKAMLDAGAHAYALTSARDALKAAVEREENR